MIAMIAYRADESAIFTEEMDESMVTDEHEQRLVRI